ncbi:MAG TPA: calcium-binding protein [Solirubrobacteraceae bacterium]|jgi:Ca2+-binding RTX toxin-like protein
MRLTPPLALALLALALLAGALLSEPAAAVVVGPPSCNGKAATIFRGSGHAGTDGAAGDPMKVTGTSGADVIVGDTGKDVLRGASGDDTICGGGGNDLLVDGSGADWVDGEDGGDLLFAGQGTDRLGGGDGRDAVSYEGRTGDVWIALGGTSNNGIAGENDTIADDVESAKGGNGGDHIDGSDGPNLLTGGSGSDTIRGHDGNDKIYDGPGEDAVEGGNGNDTMVAGYDADSMSGGAGTDLVTYAARTYFVVADLAGNAPDSEDTFLDPESDAPDVENLRGGSYHDRLLGNAQANVIHGGGGDDGIAGRGGDDIIYDDAGHDTVYGDDPYSGDSGNDLIVAGTGDDVYEGQGGFDRVSYRARSQPVSVEIGAAGLAGEEGEGDTVRGSVEGVHGGSGNDILKGSLDDNTLWGGPGDGADRLDGLGGSDTLYGEGGPDDLFDGEGADLLFGMMGDDVLDLTSDGAFDAAYCGAGSDTVINGNTLLEPIDVYDADCEEIPQQ